MTETEPNFGQLIAAADNIVTDSTDGVASVYVEGTTVVQKQSKRREHIRDPRIHEFYTRPQ